MGRSLDITRELRPLVRAKELSSLGVERVPVARWAEDLLIGRKEAEDEDEDEHDSGRIARLERLFFCSVRDLLASIDWSSSDDRAVFIPAKSRPSPILQSFSFRNRPRPRTRLPSGLLEEKGRETQNTQLTPLKKPLLGPYCGAKTPIPVPSRNS